MKTAPPSELRNFAVLRRDVEAVLQRCGIDTYDLVLVDLEGNWTRWVFASEEAAVEAADALDIPIHRGWDERMNRRMNLRDHWDDREGQRRGL